MINVPKQFFPKFNCELIRLGNNSDGGYVISKKSVENSNFLISFGLSNDWSFEEAYTKMTNQKVYCFDLSVNNIFWIKNFIKSLLNIFFLRDIKENFKNLISYFRYKIFFGNKNNVHIKKFIFPLNSKKNIYKKEVITDLNKILETTKEKCYLKIDIEGNEYRILDQIILNQKKINGMSIEFHDFDLHINLISDFINKFDLEIVHLHVNNFGLINKNSIPSVVEFSFANKEYVDISGVNKKTYPLYIDKPCNKELEDENITFINL